MLWYKERVAAKKVRDEERKSQEYGLLLRMAMLVWLVRNRHTLWMWKSGACAAILTNNNAHMERDARLNWWPEASARSACDYVSKFSHTVRAAENPFSTSPNHFVTWSTPLR